MAEISSDRVERERRDGSEAPKRAARDRRLRLSEERFCVTVCSELLIWTRTGGLRVNILGK